MNENLVTFADSDSGGRGCAGGSIGRTGMNVSADGTLGATACSCPDTAETTSAPIPAAEQKTVPILFNQRSSMNLTDSARDRTATMWNGVSDVALLPGAVMV